MFKPVLRPASDDDYVWSTVYFQNEYKLPESIKGWRVLDIGANTGAFAKLCDDRGAATIMSFEPFEQSREIYARNLADAKADVTLRPEAVWGAKGMVSLRRCPNINGFASYSVVMNLSQPGVLVPVITFADALNFGIWDLAKIDCEGAEYALFDTDYDTVRRAAAYVIEFHLAHRHDEMVERMRGYGYSLEWRQNLDGGNSIMHFNREEIRQT